MSIVPANRNGFRARANDQTDRQLDQYRIIEAAVGCAPRSQDRRTAVAIAARNSGTSEKTLGRWCAAFDEGGLASLGRAQPSDAGLRRQVVSAIFDKAFIAAGHPAESLAAIGKHVEASIKGLWMGRAADAGWADLNTLAERLLLEKCREMNLVVAPSAFRIGRHAVERFRDRSMVNLRRNNAKAYQDRMPGIARDWTAFAPMEVVVADVKHLDVCVRRDDGSTAWPKLIGFMDAGTGRIFHFLVLCEKRRSINQELVIEAFIAMAMHGHWGFPQTLYLDNGSEFGGLDKITAALTRLNNNEGREIIHAKPYSAKSKPIEALFARLDRYCFSSMEGYSGGDRQAKKTQNVGREPIPYQGSWEQFSAEVDGLISYYHGRKVGGQWQASPNDMLRAKVAAGWRPITPNAFALDMAFHTVEPKKVKRGVITTRAGRFYHPELLTLVAGTDVQVAIPFRASEAPIAWLPSGPVRLEPDAPFAARDIEGAKESSRRQTSYNRTIRKMEQETVTIDPVAIKLRIAAEQQSVTIGRADRIDHGTSLRSLGHAKQLVDQRQLAAIEVSSEETLRRDRATERLLKGKLRAAA